MPLTLSQIRFATTRSCSASLTRARCRLAAQVHLYRNLKLEDLGSDDLVAKAGRPHVSHDRRDALAPINVCCGAMKFIDGVSDLAHFGRATAVWKSNHFSHDAYLLEQGYHSGNNEPNGL